MAPNNFINTPELELLKDLLGEEFQPLLVDFKQQLMASISTIESGLKNKNYQAVKALAHQIKGSAKDLHCTVLIQHYSQLEAAAQATNQVELNVVFHDLKYQVANVISQLECYFSQS